MIPGAYPITQEELDAEEAALAAQEAEWALIEAQSGDDAQAEARARLAALYASPGFDPEDDGGADDVRGEL